MARNEVLAVLVTRRINHGRHCWAYASIAAVSPRHVAVVTS